MYHKEQEERMEEGKHNVVCYGVAFAGVQHTRREHTSEVFKVGCKFHTFLTVRRLPPHRLPGRFAPSYCRK